MNQPAMWAIVNAASAIGRMLPSMLAPSSIRGAMATRANAAVNVCDGTRLRPENIQAAYAGSEENREPLSLTTVEQDASTSWNRRDGKCLLSGSLPGEPKGYFRETPVRHSSANLAGASFSPR